MSAAHSASQATVRRAPTAAAPRPAPAMAPTPQRATRAGNAPRFAEDEPEIRVNLSDVTFERPQLNADIFKPTLMTRLFALFGK